MRRALFLLPILFVCAGALGAERIVDFNDTVYLRDHETVRYRIPIDYGFGSRVDVRIFVRGFDSAPRARLLNPDFGLARGAEDTSGDWIVDFTHATGESRHYLEVDSVWGGSSGHFEIRVQIDAEDGTGAFADVQFVKYFVDYESHHNHDCSTGENSGWWLGALAALALGAWLWRRRLSPC
jgi:MYXO-CTERM domain-containing protein